MHTFIAGHAVRTVLLSWAIVLMGGGLPFAEQQASRDEGHAPKDRDNSGGLADATILIR
jgi:hypothetical protein